MTLKQKLSVTGALIAVLSLAACQPSTQTEPVKGPKIKLETIHIDDDLGPPETQDIKIDMSSWVSENPIIQQIFDTAKTHDFAYNFTRDLTTELGPRLAGSSSEARARRWTEDRFKDAGLDNIRIEPFTIQGWTRGAETFRIRKPFPQEMHVTALGGSVATPRGGITADIAYFA